MIGRCTDDYIFYDKTNDVIDPLSNPPNKPQFPLRIVAKAGQGGGKAEQGHQGHLQPDIG